MTLAIYEQAKNLCNAAYGQAKDLYSAARGMILGNKTTHADAHNDRIDLFKELVHYHIAHNLQPALEGGPVPEGHENKSTHGCFIAANGPTLEQHLVNDEVITQRPEDAHTYRLVRTSKGLVDHLDDHKYHDGGHVWDGKHQLITHVSRFNTTRNKLSRWQHLKAAILPWCASLPAMDYEQFVPADYLSHDKSVPIYDSDGCVLGTKTQAAIDLAHRYGVQTMLIKQSAYGPPSPEGGVVGVGMGKVCRFDENGLAEEVFFVRGEEGPFIDEQHKVAGIRRCYEKRAGALVKVSEGHIDPATYFPAEAKKPVALPSPHLSVAYAAS